MSDISKFLDNLDKVSQTDEWKEKRQVVVSAEDLFFKGHITAEEYENICKGATVAMSIKKEPKETAPTLGIVGTASAIKRLVDTVDSVLDTWVPKQINNTLIRTKREMPRPEVADPENRANIKVVFTLLDFEREMQRSLATDIALDLRSLTGVAQADRAYYDYFVNNVTNHIQMIVLQLVKSIQSGKFGNDG